MGRDSWETESWQIGRSTLHVGRYKEGDDAGKTSIGNRYIANEDISRSSASCQSSLVPFT